MTTPYERSTDYSEGVLSRLRDSLGKSSIGNDTVVLTCGSYARREASEQSDVDFFVISETANDNPALKETIAAKIKEIVPNEPSQDGAFGEEVGRNQLLENIGGEYDSNRSITRRILFLLEGEWLFNENGLRNFRRQILERYIRDDMADHQLALFLLNDVIRYYRTVAVDYEYKTAELENPRPWAIRNIKLVFSRKLLYASGLFSIAMTADKSRYDKVSILENLFGIPVVERMISICGKANMETVLDSYNSLLGNLEDPTRRGHLVELERANRQDPVFRRIKNEGHQFTRELLKLFENTFDATHPIRRAVVF